MQISQTAVRPLSATEQLYVAEARLYKAIKFYRQLSGSQCLSYGRWARIEKMQCEMLLEHVQTLINDPIEADRRKLGEWTVICGNKPAIVAQPHIVSMQPAGVA